MFYTGLSDFVTFQSVFETLMEHGADKLSTESVGEINIYSLGRKHKLQHVDEFLLVMLRLRQGFLVKDLDFVLKYLQVLYQRYLILGSCSCANAYEHLLCFQN